MSLFHFSNDPKRIVVPSEFAVANESRGRIGDLFYPEQSRRAGRRAGPQRGCFLGVRPRSKRSAGCFSPASSASGRRHLGGRSFSSDKSPRAQARSSAQNHPQHVFVPASSFEPQASKTYPSTVSSRIGRNRRAISDFHFSTRQISNDPTRIVVPPALSEVEGSEFAVANEPRDLQLLLPSVEKIRRPERPPLQRQM
jgi:hypothetical protein